MRWRGRCDTGSRDDSRRSPSPFLHSPRRAAGHRPAPARDRPVQMTAATVRRPPAPPLSFISRSVRLALLWLLHVAASLEERITLWWQTGRWAAADWAQAALARLPAAPAWAPAALAWVRPPRRVGGVPRKRGAAPPAPARTAALVLAEVVPSEMPIERVAAVVHW